jgi:membrane fusion protein (multidrug efflux system)
MTHNAASSESARPKTHRRGLFRILLAVTALALVAAAGGVYYRLYLWGIVYSDDARVDANLVDIAPDVAGTVRRLAVHEGDKVARGEFLFALDTTPLEAALARAEAEAGQAEAQVAIAEAEHARALHGPRAAEIRIAEAARERASAQAKLASTQWERTRALYEKSVVTEAESERVQAGLETAERELSEAENRLQLVRSGTRAEEIAATKARVAAAQANLAAARSAVSQARINVERCRIEAPFAGIVVREWREAGATVAPGTPVLTLLDPSTLHVSANIDEKDLGKVSVGDRVSIAIDAFSGEQLQGHVDTILRATNSKFGLVPAEGVSGTFIKVAQRVPLRIGLDTIPNNLLLSPGLSVEVRIHVARAEAGHALALGRRD